MWIEARGRSMWPVLVSGDALKVERTGELQRGDIAVLCRDDGTLVSHLVLKTRPLVTASMSGRIDQGLSPLGRVLAVRRGCVELPVSRLLLCVFQQVYASPLRAAVHAVWQRSIALGVAPVTIPIRRYLFEPTVTRLGATDLREAAFTLSRWSTPPGAELQSVFEDGRVAGVRLRSGRLGGLAAVHRGVLVHAFLLRRLQGLGIETQLIAAIDGPDLLRAEIHPAQAGFHAAFAHR